MVKFKDVVPLDNVDIDEFEAYFAKIDNNEEALKKYREDPLGELSKLGIKIDPNSSLAEKVKKTAARYKPANSMADKTDKTTQDAYCFMTGGWEGTCRFVYLE